MPSPWAWSCCHMQWPETVWHFSVHPEPSQDNSTLVAVADDQSIPGRQLNRCRTRRARAAGCGKRESVTTSVIDGNLQQQTYKQHTSELYCTQHAPTRTACSLRLTVTPTTATEREDEAPEPNKKWQIVKDACLNDTKGRHGRARRTHQTHRAAEAERESGDQHTWF